MTILPELLHYCVISTEDYTIVSAILTELNHYDLILVWQLSFQVFFSHFIFSLALSSCKCLITMPFRLIISSFKLLMLSELSMDFSNLPSESWLITLSQHSFVSGVIIMGHNKIQISIGLFQKKSPQVGLRIWNFQGYQWLWLALSPFFHDESSITIERGEGVKKCNSTAKKIMWHLQGFCFWNFQGI